MACAGVLGSGLFESLCPDSLTFLVCTAYSFRLSSFQNTNTKTKHLTRRRCIHHTCLAILPDRMSSVANIAILRGYSTPAAARGLKRRSTDNLTALACLRSTVI